MAVLYILWSLVFASVQGDTDILIAGTTNFLTAWNRLTSSYAQFRPDLNLGYVDGTAGGTLTLLNNGTASAAFTDPAMITLLQNVNFSTSPYPRSLFESFINLPFLAQPYAVIYNIPEIPNNNLTLTWDMLLGIFLGKIIYWNDTALVEQNSALANVNQRITTVQRTDPSAITFLLSESLSEYNKDDWTYGAVFTWPPELVQSVGNIIFTSTHIFATFSEVFANPYSISVGPFSFFYAIGFAQGVNYAGFLNESTNSIYYPDNITDLTEAIDKASYDPFQDPTQEVKLDTNWPLSIMGYLVLPKNSSQLNCNDYFEALKYLRWCYNDSRAKDILVDVGFHPPSTKMVEKIVEYLDTLTCNDKIVLQVGTIPEDFTGQIVATSLYWMLLLFTIAVLIIYKNKKNKKIAQIYMIILSIGLILCGIAAILWTFDPWNDTICKTRWWFTGLGMVIFSSGVFCRSYQLKKIHRLIKDGKYQSSKKINHIRLLVSNIGALIIIEVIILVILEISTPWTKSVRVNDVVNRIGANQCTNSIPFIWMIIQSVYLTLILMMGVYFMYSTWGISSSVDDTRINVLMVFICLVTLGVSDVIIGYSSQDELSTSWWAISLIIVWSVSMMCSIFVPKLVKASQKSSSGSTHDLSSASASASASASTSKKNTSSTATV